MTETTTPQQPRQQILSARVPFADYLRFEALCCEHGTTINRAIGEYLSHCLRRGAVNSQHLLNDTPDAAIEPGAQGNNK
jgi:hypothetical protein